MLAGDRWIFAIVMTAMSAIVAFTLLGADERDGLSHIGATSAVLGQPEQASEPPPPTTSTSVVASRCHVSYLGGCVSPAAPAAACVDAATSGKAILVVGPDVYGLDPDRDRIAC